MKYIIQAFKVSDGRPVAGPDWRDEVPPGLLARLKTAAELLAGEPVAMFVGDGEGIAQPEGLLATISDGQVVAVAADPSWQPPAVQPPESPLLEGLSELAEVVRRNIAASPHDKRFLTQKTIGKQAIAWIKEHPACTPQEAEDHVMALVQAELAGEPMVPKLYWEHQGAPQGLAMSYLHEAIRRGYLPAGTPLTWASLAGLIVATPEAQIAAWLKSL